MFGLNHAGSKLTLAALGLTLGLVGCESVSEPAFGTGEATVVLSRAGSSASFSAALAGASQDIASAMGNVPLSAVESIEVAVTRVDVLLIEGADSAAADTTAADTTGTDEDEGGESRWYSLELTEASAIDLIKLATDTTGGIALASGELPAGEYGNVRLFFSAATITFKEAVRVGNATYEAGVAHDLFIPSGSQTGIKIPQARFEVGSGESETVNVLFNASASVRNIVARGPNGILMTPVLGAGR